MKTFGIGLSAAILASLFTWGIISWQQGDTDQTEARPFTETPRVERAPEDLASGSGGADFTYAAERTLPAVVHIRSRSNVNAPRGQRPFNPFEELFGVPFGSSEPRPREREGTGSGVIINADGLIVTNNHVVANADDIVVTLNNKKTFPAEIIGTDPSTDLALIKIDAEDLPFLQLANSDDVRVGEWVLAVGNPFNLASTATAGIVSAKARSINILEDVAPIESFIQTDAAINPGNSGGALVNLRGELVGINTAIASPTGTYSGYAFAVPSQIVQKVVSDIREFGRVQRAFLGVFIREVDGPLAQANGLSVTQGVLVDSLVAGGSAARADLRRGDVIVRIDDQPIRTSSQLLEQIGRRRPGDEVEVTVVRKGREQQVDLVLRSREGDTALRRELPASSLRTQLGADFRTLRREEANRNDISGGVVVERLYPGILRANTDLEPGFIIMRVNGREISSVEALQDLLSKEKGGVMLEGIYPDRNGKFYYAFGMDDAS